MSGNVLVDRAKDVANTWGATQDKGEILSGLNYGGVEDRELYGKWKSLQRQLEFLEIQVRDDDYDEGMMTQKSSGVCTPWCCIRYVRQ